MLTRFRAALAVLITVVGVGWASAQGPFSAQIQSAIRSLLANNQTITGTWTTASLTVAGDLTVNNTITTLGGNAILSRQYADYPLYSLTRADGTSSVPTSVLDTEQLSEMNFAGYISGVSGYRVGARIRTYVDGTVGTSVPTKLVLDVFDNALNAHAVTLYKTGVLEVESLTASGVLLTTGTALKTDTTTAHTALVQAYDVNATAYVSFITLTNANAPTFVLAPSGDGTVEVRANTYKSSDGTTGVTVAACTGFKNGLCISGT